MKKYVVILAFVFLSFVKDNRDVIGTYTYSSEEYFYTEKIIFSKNYTFNYHFKSEFIIENIDGYYNVFSDTIILNSSPQRDKLIVNEKYRKGNNILFEITDKQLSPLRYHLHIIYEDNSVLELRNQYMSSKFKKKETPIKGFYLVTTRGLKLPTYFIKGTNTNHFSVLLEPRRVFEAEKWIFHNNEITPIGIDGEYQKYSLTKED